MSIVTASTATRVVNSLNAAARGCSPSSGANGSVHTLPDPSHLTCRAEGEATTQAAHHSSWILCTIPTGILSVLSIVSEPAISDCATTT